MATVTVVCSGLWSLTGNQAGLAYLQHPLIGISYNNRFLLNELSTKAIGFVYPSRFGAIGLSFDHYGYSSYNESKIGLAYAGKLGKHLAVGINLDYMRTAIGNDYGAMDVVTFELGLIAKIAENFRIGTHVFNPIQARIADNSNEKIPSIYQLGLSFNFSSQLITFIEAEKNSLYPLNVKVGLEYNIKDLFYLRTGVTTNPVKMSMGFGLILKRFFIDIASTYHTVLGFSPCISLTYQLKK